MKTVYLLCVTAPICVLAIDFGRSVCIRPVFGLVKFYFKGFEKAKYDGYERKNRHLLHRGMSPLPSSQVNIARFEFAVPGCQCRPVSAQDTRMAEREDGKDERTPNIF